jgi:hypothetical protein
MGTKAPLVALVAVVVLGVQGPASATAETLLLDSQAPLTTASAPVQSLSVLTSNAFYAVEVSGTFSAFRPKYMQSSPPFPYVLCGVPEAAPAIPSPGRPDSRVGADAEFVFSRPFKTSCKQSLPARTVQLQLDTGAGFLHHPPVSAASPVANHHYVYVVPGANAPLQARLLDRQLSDNNGVLAIELRLPTAAECAADAVCSVTPNAPAGSTPSGVAGAGAGAGTAPATRTTVQPKCGSRRLFQIRLRDRKTDPIVAATVTLGGKRLKVRRMVSAGRVRTVVTVDLRGRKQGVYTVRAVERTKSGRTHREVRKYRTCALPRPTGAPNIKPLGPKFRGR